MAELWRALGAREDARFALFCFDDRHADRAWPHSTPPGVLIPGVRLGIWNARARLEHMLRSQGPSVVILSAPYSDWRTQMAASVLKSLGIPFVFLNEAPALFSTPLRRFVRAALLQRILKRACGVVGMTHLTARRYRDDHGFKGPVAAVPYSRDLTPFLSLPLIEASTDARPVRFLVLGQLIPRKSVDTAIQAVRSLEGSWRLDIVGDGPLRASLERSVPESLRDRIRFHGFVDYGRIPEVLESSDVLVFPTLWDGFGMVLVEALAAGRPVISSDRAMAGLEYIRDGVNGWCYPAGNAQALAECMRTLVRDVSRLPGLSSSARASVLANCNVAEDARKLSEFVLSVAADA